MSTMPFTTPQTAFSLLYSALLRHITRSRSPVVKVTAKMKVVWVGGGNIGLLQALMWQGANNAYYTGTLVGEVLHNGKLRTNVIVGLLYSMWTTKNECYCWFTIQYMEN